MRISLACLLIGYLLSQFYRAFLAVLAPTLTAELGVTAEVLARASGLWFLAFALTQLPLGWALDSLGPRRSAAWLTAVGALGAALFAAARPGPAPSPAAAGSARRPGTRAPRPAPAHRPSSPDRPTGTAPAPPERRDRTG